MDEKRVTIFCEDKKAVLALPDWVMLCPTPAKTRE